jgi:hypothetical protein
LARSRRQFLLKSELGLGEVAPALLWRLDAAHDPLRSAVRVFDDDLDRLHSVRCAPSSRAAAATDSDQLGAQGRVNALGESSA